MMSPAQLESVLPGLYASAPESLPFAPSLHIRAFLLRRERGNVLVYSVTGLESDAAAIEAAGGISRHYLNHRHEAMFASDWVDAPLFVHGRKDGRKNSSSEGGRSKLAVTGAHQHLPLSRLAAAARQRAGCALCLGQRSRCQHDQIPRARRAGARARSDAAVHAGHDHGAATRATPPLIRLCGADPGSA